MKIGIVNIAATIFTMPLLLQKGGFNAPLQRQRKGTWYVKVLQKDPVLGKPKHVLKRGFETKRAASQREAEYKASETIESSVTIDEMLKHYLDAADSSDTARSMKTNWIRNHFAYSD